MGYCSGISGESNVWGAAQGSVVRAICGVLLRDQWCEKYVGCRSGISRESNVWGAAQGSVV